MFLSTSGILIRKFGYHHSLFRRASVYSSPSPCSFCCYLKQKYLTISLYSCSDAELSAMPTLSSQQLVSKLSLSLDRKMIAVFMQDEVI